MAEQGKGGLGGVKWINFESHATLMLHSQMLHIVALCIQLSVITSTLFLPVLELIKKMCQV